METINCIFCGKESDLVVIEENGYFGRKCRECGLIYISPRPSVEEIIELYRDDNANFPPESHISGGYAKRLYARHSIKLIKQYARGGKILDIGAGAGYFLDEARKAGFEPYGLELNAMLADHIRSRMKIPCEESPFDESSFNSMKFDVIYHCDVISHFYDPIGEFIKINNKLNDGGLMVFETGNGGDIDRKFLKYFTSFQYPDHLFFFSESNLRELLERTGFRILEVYRFSILPQLMVFKTVSKLVNLKKLAKKTEVPSKKCGADKVESRYKSKSLNFFIFLKNAFFCFMYVTRYKIGRIMPKKWRPQTLIVVAEKTGTYRVVR